MLELDSIYHYLTSETHVILYTYFWIVLPIFTIYICMVISTLNIQITIEILKTFEFWLKIIYFIRWWICATIYITQKLHQTPNHQYYFTLFMVLLLFCLMDGLQQGLKGKATLAIVASLTLTWSAGHWTFDGRDQYTVSIGDSSFTVDIVAMAASSIHIVTLFAWKQTVFALFGSTKSSIIKRFVTIVWI